MCQKCLGFPGGASDKEPTGQCRRHERCGFDPWVGKIPWRRAWQPQYSCLENSMDRGAWQATVQGFKESETTEVIYATISIKCMYCFVLFCSRNVCVRTCMCTGSWCAIKCIQKIGHCQKATISSFMKVLYHEKGK